MTTFRLGGNGTPGVCPLASRDAGLISLVNEFYHQSKACQSFEEDYNLTSRFLGEFMVQLAQRFTAEEDLMEDNNYPYREEHVQEHGAFTARLYALRRRHKLGEPAMSFEVFQQVRNWMTLDGADDDNGFAPFLERATMFARHYGGYCAE